jgi:hypothetical protein
LALARGLAAVGLEKGTDVAVVHLILTLYFSHLHAWFQLCLHIHAVVRVTTKFSPAFITLEEEK